MHRPMRSPPRGTPAARHRGRRTASAGHWCRSPTTSQLMTRSPPRRSRGRRSTSPEGPGCLDHEAAHAHHPAVDSGPVEFRNCSASAFIATAPCVALWKISPINVVFTRIVNDCRYRPRGHQKARPHFERRASRESRLTPILKPTANLAVRKTSCLQHIRPIRRDFAIESLRAGKRFC